MSILTDALAVAENKRDNFGVPKSMRAKFKVDISDLKDKQITIDEIIVASKRAKDKSGAFIQNKSGEDVYNQIVFIAFGGDKYTVTKSALMAAQLDEIEPVIKNEAVEIAIPALKDATVTIKYKGVKYADKKTYDQPYLSD